MVTIFIRTLIIYLILIGAMRLMGKRQIGELEVSELVTTLLLSEIATLPIENQDIPILYAVIPIVTLLFLEVAASVLLSRFPKLKGILSARPSILVNKGTVDQKELSRMRLSLEELFSELRQQDVTDLEDVEYAILEKNGKISVILKNEAAPVTVRQARIKPDRGGMTHILVSGGVINRHGMKTAGVSEDQLKKAAEEILEDPQCGAVFRIKGFIKKENGDWVELNATQKEMSLQKIPVGQEVVIVIGEKLNEARIQEYWVQGEGGNKS